MQCQRCQFENMPGLERCMQCGTLLSASGMSIEVHPPRLPAWKKPFRRLFLFFRLTGIQSPSLPRVPDWAKEFVNSTLFTSIFSVIPGLAQLIQGQFLSILWYWIVWAVLIAMTLFYWGAPQAGFLFSFALSLHVWIAMRGGILRDFQAFWQRMAIFVMLSLLYWFIYYQGGLFGLRVAGFQGGYSLFNLPSQQIETGHYFLGRTRNFTLDRGDIVYTGLHTVANHGRGYGGAEGFVRIVGLPNETLAIREGRFWINEKALDPDFYPVPQWLGRLKDYTVTLGSAQYFIVAEFRGQGYNNNAVNNVSILSIDDFHAKAFLQWSPWRNRGFIESNP